MTTTGIYLNFSRLFDQSISISPCELLVNGEFNVEIGEVKCVKVFSNSNYSIRCPICNREIHHVIPNSIFSNNVEDCYDSGK